ncbi:hypothetical protein [Hyphomonas sp.]|uniref:hypothetical protein n=1 Tax=Hyphomonas sp. TaxID=87 RepID=UPI001BCE0118|nr:hypothetical protein [Hyphomonas sp.]
MTRFSGRRLALPVLAFTFLVAACSGVSGEGFVNRTPDDYCKLSDRSTLFLIDRTTTFDAGDQTVLMESLGGVVDRLETGDRIIIATISDHYSKTRRLADACKPGCPQSGGVVDEIMGSCSTMKAKQDQQQYISSLAASLREVINTAEDASGSDIIRTIGHWTGSTEAEPYTRIIVYSDMLENSDMIAWSKFAALPEDELMGIVADHRAGARTPGTLVRVIGYGRLHDKARSPLPAELDAKLRGFWSRYFSEGGGQVEFSAQSGG